MQGLMMDMPMLVSTLLRHAARHYGVKVLGVTLSRE